MSSNQFNVFAKDGLNLRSAPKVEPGNIVQNLPQTQIVTKLSDTHLEDWWKVSTVVSGITLTGFVNNRFLLSEGSNAVVGIEKTTQAFRQKVKEMANKLNANHNFILAVMSFETGGTFSPAIQNRHSRATGLIQFLPSTASRLGTNIVALGAMTAIDQLDFVEEYFKPFTGQLNTLEDTYMAVLFPRAIGKGNNFVLFKRPSSEYVRNHRLDADRDGEVTVHEAASKVRSRILN